VKNAQEILNRHRRLWPARFGLLPADPCLQALQPDGAAARLAGSAMHCLGLYQRLEALVIGTEERQNGR
jgi:hypothetical protein